MLSYTTIRDIAHEAAERAAAEGLAPTNVQTIDLPACPPFPFPFLGDYVPAGWVRVDSWAVDDPLAPDPLWCDSTGCGLPSEPALTVDGLIARLGDFKKSGEAFAFAIIEQGECQVYLGIYKPDPRDFTHTGALTPDELARLGQA